MLKRGVTPKLQGCAGGREWRQVQLQDSNWYTQVWPPHQLCSPSADPTCWMGGCEATRCERCCAPDALNQGTVHLSCVSYPPIVESERWAREVDCCQVASRMFAHRGNRQLVGCVASQHGGDICPHCLLLLVTVETQSLSWRSPLAKAGLG